MMPTKYDHWGVLNLSVKHAEFGKGVIQIGELPMIKMQKLFVHCITCVYFGQLEPDHSLITLGFCPCHSGM